MANITETESFDAGVYKIATTDPVVGGDGGISNSQAVALANRTKWLKARVDEVIAAIAALAGLSSPAFTGDPTAPTAAAGDDDTSIATTAFVHRNSGGSVSVDCAGASNIVLTADQWGVGIIILTGLLTGNINVIFPTRSDRWLVINRTTGLFSITCKPAAGTGVKVAQARGKSIYCDGTNIADEQTDLATGWRTVTAALTAAKGDRLVADVSGGVFAVTLPLNPADGDDVWIKGNFKASNLTVARNGQTINDGASDLVLDRDNITAILVFGGGSWRV